jgi:hypothetical protein
VASLQITVPLLPTYRVPLAGYFGYFGYSTSVASRPVDTTLSVSRLQMPRYSTTANIQHIYVRAQQG